MAFDAIVLAGGRAARLGGVAKPQLEIHGVTLLDRVLAAVSGAGTTVVTGPRQPASRPVTWARESPPGGGPVAGLAAASPSIDAPVVIVLAADLPWIAPVVAPLLDAVPPDGVALLVDSAGRRNHLAAAWRTTSLRHALGTMTAVSGASMGALLDGVTVVEVADPSGAGADCDTWDDLRRARDSGPP